MALSQELISLFAKQMTKNDKKSNREATVYGTVMVDGNGNKYVKLDGSDQLTPLTDDERPGVDSTSANANAGERVSVLIKNHTATVTGNISSPAARTDDVEYIGDQVAEIQKFDILVGDQLQANEAYLKKLDADKANVGELNAATAKITELEVNKANVTDLNAQNAVIEDLKVTKLDADVANIKYATIENLNATNATISQLDAKKASIEQLEAHRAEIDEAIIGKLTAAEADLTYAKISDLNATNATVGTLEADVADIDTLIFGSASGTSIQTSFANAVIAQLGNAQIKSAMIQNINASQINAGDISTNNIRVVSDDGKLLISDETIQISDDNRVRVQIGKDSSNDYSINIWDESGNLMFSKGGITDKAIKDAIIRNDMVSEDANISASKLNISSLFTEINNSTETIKSTKIYLDDKKQTLDVAFTQMSSDLNDTKGTISSQGTQLSVIQGQISSKIWQQDIESSMAGMEIGGRNLIRDSETVKIWFCSYGENPLISVTRNGQEYLVNGRKVTNPYEVAFVSGSTGDVRIGAQSSPNEATFANRFDLSNKTYTLSLWVMSDVDCTLNSFVTRQYNDSDGNQAKHVLTANTWTKITHRRTFSDRTDLDGIRVRFQIDSKTVTGTANIVFCLAKLEQGTQPTDWTPAPEDIDTETSALNTKYSSLEQTIDGISSTVSSHSSQIVNIDNRVNTTQDMAIQAANDAMAAQGTAVVLQSDVDVIKTRVSTAETKIEQNTQQIALRATKSEVTETLKGYYDAEQTEAAIKLSADEITSTVSEQIENIQVGGRNLLKETDFLLERTNAATSIYSKTVYVDRSHLLELVGKTMTLSIYMHSPGTRDMSLSTDTVMNTRFGVHGSLTWADSSGANPVKYVYPFTTLLTKSVTNKRVFAGYTITPPSGYDTLNSCTISIQMYAKPASDNNEIWLLGYPKLEIGTIPTDWTPAPEDMATDSDLSTLSGRVSSAETKISQNTADIKLRATKTELDSALEGYYTKEEADAAILVNSSEITSMVRDTTVTKTLIEDNGTSFVSLTNAIPDSIEGLKLYGKTTQFTTTGKNIMRYTATTQTVNGVTFTANSDGSVTVNGTSTADTQVIIGNATFSGGKSYTLTGCPSGGNATKYTIYAYKDLSTGCYDYGNGVSFTPAEDYTTNVRILVRSGITMSNAVFKPMIRLSSVVDATYEPYTGGIASPNPEYPQELVSLGVNGIVDVAIAGKNMFPPAAASVLTKNGITFTSNGDGSYTVKGTATDTVTLQFPLEEGVVLREGMYLHCMNNTTSDISFMYWYSDATSSYWALSPANRIAMPSKNFGKTITNIGINMGSGTTANVTFSPMFLFSNKTTAFVPYQSIQTLSASTPNGLPGIPVTSGGNHTDASGQQWICDEIDFARGVYIQRVALFDQFVLRGEKTNNDYYGYNHNAYLIGKSTKAALCTVTSRYEYTSNDKVHFYVQGSTIWVYVPKGFDNSNNAIKVLAALEEPIETPLSAEELTAFAELANPAGTVNIFSEADMDVTLSGFASNSAVSSAQQTANQAQNRADDAVVTVTELQTVVQQLADSISMLVRDGTGGSMLRQDANGLWYFDISGLEESISNTANNVTDLSGKVSAATDKLDILKLTADELQKNTEYVRSYTDDNDQPCLELGEGDSTFKVLITNTDIRFIEGSSVPAKLNRQMLVIEKAMVRNEFQFGDEEESGTTGVWLWKRRANGNLGLMWKGVSS